MVNRYWNAALDGLFPCRCVLCRLPSHCRLPLCRGCRAELTPNHNACRRCALPLRTSDPGPTLCGRCQRRPPPFHAVHAPWIYSEYLAHIIQLWKFRGQPQLTGLLADLWLEYPPEVRDIDLMIPMPLHWRRLWQRGYNQADLLAQWLCRARPEVRIERRLLRRARATAAQSGMTAARRRRNLQGAFTVRRPCDNLRIALVDDVLTTGATAAAAATVLTEAGAIRVDVWCLARTPAPGT